MLQPKKRTSGMDLLSLKMIWIAMAISQGVYYAVLFKVKGRTVNTELLDYAHYAPVLVTIFLVLAILVPRTLWASSKKSLGQDLSGVTVGKLATAYSTGFIIRLAMFEAMAMVGFILAFLSAKNEMYSPYFAFSLFCFMLNFPSESKMKSSLA